MKQFIAGLLFILIIQISSAQDTTWTTFYEKSGEKETPSYDETISYCKKLADASPYISYTGFGMSPQGRELPLLIFDPDGHFNPASVKASGNVILMVQAGIHAGEIDGKDAMLMFFRDLAIYRKYPELMKGITIICIPIFNVDGHERFGKYNRINQNGPEQMGWRTTAQNLNLNRDYLKADAPEMKAWLKLFQDWLPDFFMDIHVTDGADYQYVSTYGLETFGSMDQGLTRWTDKVYLPNLENTMNKEGMPVFPYVAFRRWHDPRSGLRSGSASPRFSTGYMAIQNRIGLLVENHMLKDYQTRVRASYEIVKLTSRLLVDKREELKNLNRKADEYAASPAFRKQAFALDFKTGTDSVLVKFKGVEYDTVHSSLSGGTWFQYHPDKPETFEIPYFNEQVASVKVRLPEAYIIPPEWLDVIERLDLHGIAYTRLKKAEKISVVSYKFKDPSWAKSPYEGRFPLKVSYDTITSERLYPAGSVLVDMNQRSARVIAHILEPNAPDSYIYWGFFNTIFEQKEYFETYVMEDYARKMLLSDPELKAEFEKAREQNPDKFKNSYALLSWFYERSPYWDKDLDVYPVGKIYDREIVGAL